MKIPYGVSSFSVLKNEDYLYVDRTSYIQKMDQADERYVVFLRPRRFGKSLFVSMLQHYYGVEFKPSFQTLFGSTYIGSTDHPNANQYHVLKFDFSGIETNTYDATHSGFLRKIKDAICNFARTYPEMISEDGLARVLVECTPASVLSAFFLNLDANPAKIYVLIDEYDHFANELISFRLNEFKDVVSKNGYVRKFYETLKEATGSGLIDRIFITGVSPLTLDSLTSGFNIAKNISKRTSLNLMMGFTRSEVLSILIDVGITNDQLDAVMDDMTKWYNGYLFVKNGERVYNPDMVLYFVSEYLNEGTYPLNMLDTNISSDYAKIKSMISLGSGLVKTDVLSMILSGEPLKVMLTEQFSFERDLEIDDIFSLLFYQGFLTIKQSYYDRFVLECPNEVIRRLYFDFFRSILETGVVEDKLRHTAACIESLYADNDPHPLMEQVSLVLKSLSNRDAQNFDEKHLKMIMVSFLYASQVFFIKSEYESQKKYVDLLLLRRKPFDIPFQFAFELKYLKKKDENLMALVATDGHAQLKGYLQHQDLIGLSDLKAWLVVFVGNECCVLEQVN